MRLLAAVVALAAAFSLGVSATPLAKRIERLNAAAKNQPIDIDVSSYKEFTESPRNYSMFIVFTTTLPEHNCKPCNEFMPEYKILTESWSRSFQPGKLYFGLTDVQKSMDLFRQLDIQTAPMFVYVPPTEGPYASGESKIQKLHLNDIGIKAEDVANFITSKTGVKFNIRRPVDYKAIAIGAGVVIAILAILYIMRDQLIEALTGRHIWTFVSISFIIVMCSGYMWNTIRKPPYMGQHDGKIQYISGGGQYQFAVETDIVAILYGLSSAAFALLVLHVPYQSPSLQSSSFIAFAAVFLVCYSLIVSIFAAKLSYYPFRLLF